MPGGARGVEVEVARVGLAHGAAYSRIFSRPTA